MLLHVGVLGAGSIGVYIGARLAAGGRARVTLVGRPATGALLAREGLTLSPPLQHLPLSESLRFAADDPAALSSCEVILVCTKGRDTSGAAESLRPHLRPDAVVVSLQNGVQNAGRIRQALPSAATPVLRGMVPFNVAWSGSRFHQGTTGMIHIEAAPGVAPLLAAMRAGGLLVATHADMEGILWGKLLLNLNNAINALSGLPLRAQLAQRSYRLLLADVIEEARGVMAGAGIRPRIPGLVGPALTCRVLRLPDALFFRVARAQMQIDEEARSSMQDDLRRGRPTEIDDLNGEIVRLGEAPLSERIVGLVREAERTGMGPPGLSAEQIRQDRRIT